MTTERSHATDGSKSFMIFVVFAVLQVQVVSSATRKYYIAARDIVWDYAEGQQNLVDKSQQSYADKYLKPDTNRLGSKYLKTTYFQYTDDTFTIEIPKPDYLGLLGPTIRAEVGDEVDILYLNNATGTYSIHPHGVFYLKQHEGALYMDRTSGRFKTDEIVEPGKTVRLIWHVRADDAPGPNDPNCLPWVYHSHLNTVTDTNTGLIGSLVTCKKGVLNSQNERTDVSVDIPILMKIFAETDSSHIEENIRRYCLHPATCITLLEEEDGDFADSNSMRSLNGLMYGHLKGLEVCVGQKAAFYVIGMGSENDVHSLFFQGQNLKYQHRRGDTVSVYTATFVAAETTPTRAGTWLLSDMVDGMARAGMSAFYTTKYCSQAPNDSFAGQPEVTKEYFLSVEEVEWNYGPGGMDQSKHKPLSEPASNSERFFSNTPTTIGGIYKKAQFFGFTNGTYTEKVEREAGDEYMGILGPVIDVEVGDAVIVTLKNTMAFNVSFLPHAFSFNATQQMEVVLPGTQHTYTFKVPDNILDGADGDCQNFMYTSGDHPTKAHASGLVGPILICRKGYSQKENTASRRFLYVTMFDENESFLLDDNMATYLPQNATVDKDSDAFTESNIVFALNGFAFGTIPHLTTCAESDVDWYVLALGSDEDTHVISFDGNNFNTQGKNRNVYPVVPGSSAALHMKPDNLGVWMIQSMTNTARSRGAYGMYNVVMCQAPLQQFPIGHIREYYVAAEEEDWDYAPEERSLFTGQSLQDFRVDGSIFVRDDEMFAGDMYRKTRYHQYTNSDFDRRKAREAREKHLDILGPVLKAEVGEFIKVYFKNKASRAFTMHPQGLKYSAEESGKTYASARAAVSPGETRIYIWYVPPRSGPGPNDPDCIPWFYYSAVDEIKDVHTGLLGPLVVCRPGVLDGTGRRKDRHTELFVLMAIFDENKSWHFKENVRKNAPGRVGTDYGSDDEFEESNKMHAVNGRIFGNNHGLLVEYNTTVIWYMMVIGTKEDMHTVHTHGQTFLHDSDGHRDDVMSLFPGMAERVDMWADNPGDWLLHCHVLSHITEGMETTYTILQPGEKLPTTTGADYSPGLRRTEPALSIILFLVVLGYLVQ